MTPSVFLPDNLPSGQLFRTPPFSLPINEEGMEKKQQDIREWTVNQKGRLKPGRKWPSKFFPRSFLSYITQSPIKSALLFSTSPLSEEEPSLPLLHHRERLLGYLLRRPEEVGPERRHSPQGVLDGLCGQGEDAPDGRRDGVSLVLLAPSADPLQRMQAKRARSAAGRGHDGPGDGRSEVKVIDHLFGRGVVSRIFRESPSIDRRERPDGGHEVHRNTPSGTYEHRPAVYSREHLFRHAPLWF
mmetsp:Transcript_24069/g.51529  ORF Transcript_24069/g.51529 Transcript_24069/m.51529 type:complete len:243 (+) Transcript_24069:143-871(+)